MAFSLTNITPASIAGNAQTALGFFTTQKRVDIVKILNQQTLQQIFTAARPIKASVRETAKVMQYPVETGATLSDNRVSNPTEIHMELFIPSEAYTSVYPQIRNAWLNATMLSVQTRTGTYKNMIIQDMPHEETAEMFSAITMQVIFKEVIQIGAAQSGAPAVLNNYSPASPNHANTVNSGLISGLNVASSALSYFKAASVVGL